MSNPKVSWLEWWHTYRYMSMHIKSLKANKQILSAKFRIGREKILDEYGEWSVPVDLSMVPMKAIEYITFDINSSRNYNFKDMLD